MKLAVGVLGAPRLGPYPAGAVFGDCKDCGLPIMWNEACPANLPKRCVGCCSKLALSTPDALFVLPSGMRTVLASHVASVQ